MVRRLKKIGATRIERGNCEMTILSVSVPDIANGMRVPLPAGFAPTVKGNLPL
jgi:hypothetical protein